MDRQWGFSFVLPGTLLLLALLLLGTILPTRGDEWPTGSGGDSSRSSRSAEIGPSAATRLWSGSLPAIVSQQPVLGEGLVVLPRIQNFTIPTGTWIVAHDLQTGAIAWQIQLPLGGAGEWRSKVTAIRDGQVYATRSGGEVNPATLFALSPIDGSVIWESAAAIEERTTESLAFAANGDPIVGNFTSVVRIDRSNGATVWSVPRSTPTSNGALVAVFGNRGYIWEPSPDGPVITVIDLDLGQRLYSSSVVAGGLIQQLGLFVGPDGTVYAPRTQNNPLTDFLVAYDDTGAALVERWRVPIGYVPFGTHGVGHDGSVYAYRTVRRDNEVDLTILRLDPTDGAVLGQSPVILSDFPVQPRMLLDAAGRVYLTNGGFPNGKVVCLDPDLTVRWSESITNVNLGGPALGPGGILVVCGVGTDARAYATHDELALNVPEPGLAGSTNQLSIRGASPGATVFLTFGFASGTTPVPPCPGITLGIDQPRLRGAFVADGNGEIRLNVPVASGFQGLTVFAQALERTSCRLSNRIVVTFR